jgi:hypothetical protein
MRRFPSVPPSRSILPPSSQPARQPSRQNSQHSRNRLPPLHPGPSRQEAHRITPDFSASLDPPAHQLPPPSDATAPPLMAPSGLRRHLVLRPTRLSRPAGQRRALRLLTQSGMPLLRRRRNGCFSGVSSVEMAALSDCRFSVRTFRRHTTCSLVDSSVYRPPLKQFQTCHSETAGILRIWPSNRAAGFRFLAHLHLRIAGHCNRFAFLHQLKPFPTVVSRVAAVFRV